MTDCNDCKKLMKLNKLLLESCEDHVRIMRKMQREWWALSGLFFLIAVFQLYQGLK